MTTIDVRVLSMGESRDDLWKGGADRYDYSRLPDELQSKAMLAQGTVVEGLKSAVRRVVEAGQALSWAKAELPHGEYLPWVQQACGLKPQHASQLIKAAEWASNVGHVQHLDQITDAKVLFLLSADTTPEEVREWFMERCAAGDVPSRKEVQDRKRRSQGQAEYNLVKETVSVLRLSPEARELAAKAEHITTRQLMDELGVEEPPRGKQHRTQSYVYCRNGSGWWKLPFGQSLDVSAMAPRSSSSHLESASEILSLDAAAARLGCAKPSISTFLSRGKGVFVRGGFEVRRERRGLVRFTKVS